jgi:hypothetical protein
MLGCLVAGGALPSTSLTNERWHSEPWNPYPFVTLSSKLLYQLALTTTNWQPDHQAVRGPIRAPGQHCVGAFADAAGAGVMSHIGQYPARAPAPLFLMHSLPWSTHGQHHVQSARGHVLRAASGPRHSMIDRGQRKAWRHPHG